MARKKGLYIASSGEPVRTRLLPGDEIIVHLQKACVMYCRDKKTMPQITSVFCALDAETQFPEKFKRTSRVDFFKEINHFQAIAIIENIVNACGYSYEVLKHKEGRYVAVRVHEQE